MGGVLGDNPKEEVKLTLNVENQPMTHGDGPSPYTRYKDLPSPSILGAIFRVRKAGKLHNQPPSLTHRVLFLAKEAQHVGICVLLR